MKIRTKHQLITAALMASVVASIAGLVMHTQRRVLRAQALQRLDALMEGASRIAKESLDGRDRLMAVSYLMFMRREHPELAFASYTYGSHVSSLGEEGPGLIYLERKVLPSGRPVRYTVAAYPSASGVPGASLQVSTAGVSLSVSGKATVDVEEPAAGEGASVRLGFSRAMVDGEVARELEPLLRWTAGIAGFFMALGLFVNAWVARLLTGPLESLAKATALLAAGRMDVTVPVRSDDEMGALSSSFNEMAGRLRELLASREDILHALTHEINTPLNGLKGYLELWRDGLLPESAARDGGVVGTMLGAVLRMETSLGNALGLFRAGKAAAQKPVPVRLHEVFSQAVTLFAPLALERGIRVVPPAAGARSVLMAPEEPVRQIVTNLVSNAIKYAEDGGVVRMSITDGPDEVRFHVSNTGYGIPPEDLPRLFTKFYRSPAERGPGKRVPGSGLGLSIVHRAVTELGGRISVESKLGEKTLFLVVLPKRRPEAASSGGERL